MTGKWIDQVLTLAVAPELLERANEAVNARRAEGVEVEPGFAMFAVLGELGREVGPTVCGALMFRMEALSSLVQHDNAGGWVLGVDADGATLVDKAVFHAAAHATLIMDGRNTVRFDRAQFLALALQASEAEGSA